MKTIAATLFVISTGLGLNTVALAEPFNDRGVNPITALQVDGATANPTATANAAHPYRDRDMVYIVEAPVGNSNQEPMISLQAQEQGRNS